MLLQRLRHLASRTLRALGLRRPPPPPPPEPEPVVPVPTWQVVTGGILEGANLLLIPEATIWQEEMRTGDFETLLYRELQGVVDLDGATVWDVGSHVGYHTLGFARLVGANGHVRAFEPNSANRDRLGANIAANPDLAARVVVEPRALGGQDSVELFYCSDKIDDGTSSGSTLDHALTPENRELYHTFPSAEVTVVRADTLVESEGMKPPTVMKIDVEGAEASVIEGAMAMLGRYRPVILMEVHNITAMFQVLPRMLDLGYELRIIDPETCSQSRCQMLALPPGHARR